MGIVKTVVSGDLYPKIHGVLVAAKSYAAPAEKAGDMILVPPPWSESLAEIEAWLSTKDYFNASLQAGIALGASASDPDAKGDNIEYRVLGMIIRGYLHGWSVQPGPKP